MLIDNKRLFTYPILSPDSDDYENSSFQIRYKADQSALDSFSIELDFELQNEELKSLVREGKAVFVAVAECSTTSYRRNIQSDEEKIIVTIKNRDVIGKVELCGLLVSCVDLPGYTNNDWVDDYADVDFDIKKNMILAYQNIGTIDIERETDELKNASSIFQISKQVKEADAPIETELTGEKIVLRLSSKLYDMYASTMQISATQGLVNCMVILPALTNALAYFIENAEEYERLTWARTLLNAEKKRGLDLLEEIENKSPFVVAQELMESPVFNAFCDIEALQNAAQNVEGEN